MSLSGKFVLRIDPALHRLLKEDARAQNLSLNHWITQRLSAPEVPAENVVVSVIRRAFGEDVQGVVLFGSSVRHERRKSSDIDLLIALRAKRKVDRSLYHLWDESVGPLLHESYSPQFSHFPNLQEVSSLWLEIAVEGEVLFDANGLLKDSLRQVREKIAEGEYQRKLSHGHPYWVRKERENAK